MSRGTVLLEAGESGPRRRLPKGSLAKALKEVSRSIRSLGFTPVKKHRSTHSTWQCLWVANGPGDTTPVSRQRGLEGPQGTLSSVSRGSVTSSRQNQILCE